MKLQGITYIYVSSSLSGDLIHHSATFLERKIEVTQIFVHTKNIIW